MAAAHKYRNEDQNVKCAGYYEDLHTQGGECQREYRREGLVSMKSEKCFRLGRRMFSWATKLLEP